MKNIKNIILIFLLVALTKNISSVNINNNININKNNINISNIPNIDTLVAYILTQSKNDSVDINCMVQVMLNRFNKSGYKYISNMLLSNTSYGSSTIKKGGGRYWFTNKSIKHQKTVLKEVNNVLKGIKYYNMKNVFYFSNLKSDYHLKNKKYTYVMETSKHRYFK